MGAAFGEVAPYYDTLMHGVPYADWIRYLKSLLRSRKSNPARVLDIACGTGNVTELLAAEGYAMTGIDLSPGMIQAARSKPAADSLSIEYQVQDVAELNLESRNFDLAISLFDSLNYVTDPARLARAFERIYLHLAPGGVFIFDMNTDYALQNAFFDQNNLGSNDRLKYSWRSDYSAASRLCKIRMRFWYREESGLERPFEEIHWQFAYTIPEIVDMLRSAGFTSIDTFQAYSRRAPTRTSDRVFYVAARPGKR